MARTTRPTRTATRTAPLTLIPLSAAAQRLGFGPQTLRRMIARGELPAYRVSNRVMIDPLDLERIIKPIPTAGQGAA